MSSLGISLNKIFKNKSAPTTPKKAAAKKTTKSSKSKSKSSTLEVELPIRKTKFPGASLRNVVYCAGVNRASPDVLPMLGERGNELIKQILTYSAANMIGQGRSTLNEDDFNVAMDKMGMKFFSSRT